MEKQEKLLSIKMAEGRTIISEIITIAPPPLLGDISNVELASAFGADILLLNMYDVNNPRIEGGLPIEENHKTIETVKKI